MRSLAGGMPKQASQHRRQVCHQLTQGRRLGSTRSGGARRVDNQPRAARRWRTAAQGTSTRKPACRRSPTRPRTPIGWAATNGPATRCAAPWLNDLPPAPARQQREPRANRRLGHRNQPGAEPREGRRHSLWPAPCPPSDNAARQPRRPTARSRAGASCRPSAGEPTALC